jgi:hypothetical protein
MAAAWCLRWGLSRSGTWLLPPPTRYPLRALHKQVDGTEFQSIYSLDKLYPESKGSDTAWRVPVSREGQHGKGGSSGCWVTSESRRAIGWAWSYTLGPRARNVEVVAEWAGLGCRRVLDSSCAGGRQESSRDAVFSVCS